MITRLILSLGLSVCVVAVGCTPQAGAGEPPWAAQLRAACRSKADEASKAERTTVVGKDGWLFFAPELRHMGAGKFWGEEAAKVSRATKPEYADPLPAILDFAAQLDERGIELILVPVPPKVVIYPEMLADGAAAGKRTQPPRGDPHHQAFYRLLREKGIRVLDLAPDFLDNRFPKDGALYCKQDTHWSGIGCVLAARRLASETGDRPWLKDVPRLNLSHEWRSVEISGDLWRDLKDESVPKETLLLRFVWTKSDGGLQPVGPDRASPVVLLGDSHALVFHAGADMHARGAGLADQLALELGFAVDLVGVRGSGATPARITFFRRSMRDKDYLAGKKLVIWCFSAREFTESMGWRKVPVSKWPPDAGSGRPGAKTAGE